MGKGVQDYFDWSRRPLTEHEAMLQVLRRQGLREPIIPWTCRKPRST